MHCLMTRIIDSFKEIYPHLKMPIIYEPTAVNLISTINDCLSNVKAEQERVSATLKEFFGDSSKLPAPISIEQLVGSVKKKIHESKTR